MYSSEGAKYPATILTPHEIDSLICACSDRASTGLRNRGLITVMFDGGLRVSEALGLRPADLDRSTGTVTVAATRRSRVVLLTPAALADLDRWLERRQRLGIGIDSPVFCTLKGGPIQSPYVRALLPRLARKIGLRKRVHPRALRDAYAAQLAASRVPPDLVQARLGHGSRVTTDRLLRRLAPHLSALRSAEPGEARPTGRGGLPFAG